MVPLAEGFEEIETATIVDVLRRAEVEVVLAGLANAGPCRGSRGMVFVPDAAFEQATGPWDLVVLPGGLGGTMAMRDHQGLQALLRQRGEQGELLAAICAAPLALEQAGLLQEGGFTCYPGIELQLKTPGRNPQQIVDAGELVTSQGPGTAMAFALYLVERLMGNQVRDDVAGGLLHG